MTNFQGIHILLLVLSSLLISVMCMQDKKGEVANESNLLNMVKSDSEESNIKVKVLAVKHVYRHR